MFSYSGFGVGASYMLLHKINKMFPGVGYYFKIKGEKVSKFME